MKKIIALTLGLLMLALCACGTNAGKTNDGAATAPTTAAAAGTAAENGGATGTDASSSGFVHIDTSNEINITPVGEAQTMASGETKPAETTAAPETTIASDGRVHIGTYTPEITPVGDAVGKIPEIHVDVPYIEISGVTLYTPKEVDVSKVEQFRLEQAAQTQKDLLAKLTAVLESAGLSVLIDAATGEISLDSAVLFGGDSADLSADGKAFLNKFINAYSSVMLDSEFDGFIAKIMVEGHTAPTQTSYEDDMPLSAERAKVVRNYCLSDAAGLSSQSIQTLSALMEAQGLSNAYPVKDASGNVDMAASRRVAFRFLVNI